MTQIVIPRGQLATAHNSAVFNTTSTTYVDITGMSISVTAGTRPVQVVVSGLIWNNTANVMTEVILLEDGTQVSGQIASNPVANNYCPISFTCPRTPTAGSHVYKLQMKVDAASTGSFYGGTTYAADLTVNEV